MKNGGAALGIQLPGLVWLTAVVLIAVAVISIKNKWWGGMLMVAGGGLNWWERVTTGGVTDYWKIPGTSIYNNLNDWLIFLGLLAIIGQILWQRRTM